MDEDLRILPATAERWRDLETLFGPRGAVAGCWCMYWRLPRKEFAEGKGEGNREALRALVERADSAVHDAPGLLAYVGDQPVGWIAVAPREAYPRLERSRILKRLDDAPVWSISCLFIDKAHRRRGVSTALIRSAVAYIAERGGTTVEAYPVEPKEGSTPDAFAWTGIASAFAKAGFVEVGRRADTRPIMRFEISAAGAFTMEKR